MNLGNKQLIDVIVDEFHAPLDVKAQNEVSVMHYAA